MLEEAMCFLQKPKILYHCSSVLHDKKIKLPINDNDYNISCYTEDWLSLVSPYIPDNNTLNIQKGLNKKRKYVKLTKEDIKILNNELYLYEITETNNFIPFPSKNNTYKYIISKDIKYNRLIEINDVIEQLKNLDIEIIKI
jgi:hypothetical protein